MGSCKFLLIDFNPEMERMGESFNQNQMELAWVAGFVDGEGCLTVSKNRTAHSVIFDLAQVNERPLLRVQAVLGGEVVRRKDVRGFHYQWRLYGAKAIAAIRLILPYLSNKQRQAELLIEFQETIGSVGKGVSIETLAKREAIWAELKVLNKRRKLLAVSAERLSEGTPATQPDDAIVRSHGNNNHEKETEMVSSNH